MQFLPALHFSTHHTIPEKAYFSFPHTCYTTSLLPPCHLLCFFQKLAPTISLHTNILFKKVLGFSKHHLTLSKAYSALVVVYVASLIQIRLKNLVFRLPNAHICLPAHPTPLTSTQTSLLSYPRPF